MSEDILFKIVCGIIAVALTILIIVLISLAVFLFKDIILGR